MSNVSNRGNISRWNAGQVVLEASKSSERPSPAVDVIEFFRTRTTLVEAAIAALDAIPLELTKLKAILGSPHGRDLNDRLNAVEKLVNGASIGTDNLLVASRAAAQDPFVICSISRQMSGAVDVRTVEIDRDALALVGASNGTAGRPLNNLVTAVGTLTANTRPETIDDAAAAIDVVLAQVKASVSRLSIVKARLDLQQSFLASVMEADAEPPPVRLDSHLNQAGARGMALEARRLLSARSLNIASGNRKTMTSLFENHATSHV